MWLCLLLATARSAHLAADGDGPVQPVMRHAYVQQEAPQAPDAMTRATSKSQQAEERDTYGMKSWEGESR